jgi:Tfp pilus assembly PilM family ATPase
VEHIDRLAQELSVSLTYAARECLAQPVARVLVIGQGASMPGLGPHLSSACGVPCQVVRPGDVADCAAAPSLSDGPGLVAAMGLALFEG